MLSSFEGMPERSENGPSEVETIELELLLEGIYRLCGYDFRNYTTATLQRRIEHRLAKEGLASISALQERVLRDPDMMKRLLSSLTIHVTEMFRDPSFFLAFRQRVVPLLRDMPFIRIWHAGCSTGEEVYSMAILLHEEGLLQKTRIYATDLNQEVLTHARQGQFALSKMKLYTGNYLRAGGKAAFSEYYTAGPEGAEFHKFLTEAVIFAQHNLATDHSFNEFQVVLCRNVLIYFDSHLQSRVHRLIYDSLSFGGVLGLGSRETITFTECGDSYEDIDPAEPWYRKIK